ncbi:hypothetical protein BC833DRAFT_582273 [Globomyces pollinis-pini]|nr:hypothetical protein BC833DRAFT_582273 [Globomyces pollinis-pini]
MLSPNRSSFSPSSKRSSISGFNSKLSNEESIMFLKKNISSTERNAAMLVKALDGYLDCQKRTQSKGIKIGTVLQIIADQSSESIKESLNQVSKYLVENELLRADLQERIQGFSAEPIRAYPMICDRLLNDIKNQKQALLNQRKKREMAENVLLKEGGDNNKSMSRRMSKSQLELADATGMVTLSTDTLQESIYAFEERKHNDIKNCVKEMIYSEMIYHAKSLEVLTKAFEVIDSTEEFHP